MKLGRGERAAARREDGVEARSRAATRGITKALRGPVAHRLERVDQLRLLRGDVSQRKTRDAFADWRRGARARREARAQNVRALYHWARKLEGKCFEALSRYAQNRKAKRLDVERAFYERARATESRAAADLVETTRSRPEPPTSDGDANDARWTARLLPRGRARDRRRHRIRRRPCYGRRRRGARRRGRRRPTSCCSARRRCARWHARRPTMMGRRRWRRRRAGHRLSPPPVSAPPAVAATGFDPAAADALVRPGARRRRVARYPGGRPAAPTATNNVKDAAAAAGCATVGRPTVRVCCSRRSRRSSQRGSSGRVTVLEHRLPSRESRWRRRVRRCGRRARAHEWRRGMGRRGPCAARGDRVLHIEEEGPWFFFLSRVRVSEGLPLPGGLLYFLGLCTAVTGMWANRRDLASANLAGVYARATYRTRA